MLACTTSAIVVTITIAVVFGGKSRKWLDRAEDLNDTWWKKSRINASDTQQLEPLRGHDYSGLAPSVLTAHNLKGALCLHSAFQIRGESSLLPQHDSGRLVLSGQ